MCQSCSLGFTSNDEVCVKVWIKICPKYIKYKTVSVRSLTVMCYYLCQGAYVRDAVCYMNEQILRKS